MKVGDPSVPLRALLRRYKEALAVPGFVSSVLLSAVLFVASWFVNTYAILFATERASNPVTDLMLSNIPVFDVDGLFVYGTFVFAAFTVCVVCAHPKRLPFALYTVALFWMIRSGFTTLTHVAPFAHTTSEFGPSINRIFFGADQFFSAHTGMPFLGVLAFWKKQWVRYTFLAGSAFFGVIVLLGHLHYSIDVAAACFITYGIFHIAEWMFPRSRFLFNETL